jgi:hypothetical protein
LTTLENYYRQFDRTASTLYIGAPVMQRLSVAVLGLCSEVGEFLEAPSAEELGDVCWYFAMVCKQANVKELGQMFRERPHLVLQTTKACADAMVIYATKIASYVKKIQEKDREVDYVQLQSLLAHLFAAMVRAAEGFFVTLHPIMYDNLEKLANRHGSKFDPNHDRRSPAFENQR